MKKRSAKCLFCGSGELSNEHVFASSLIERAQLKESTILPAHLHVKKGLTQRPRRFKPSAFKTRKVCKRCNNEWMSTLENSVCRLLEPLIQAEWPVLYDDFLRAVEPDYETLARWMLKTAIIVEEASPPPEQKIIAPALYRMASGGDSVGADFHVLLGKIAYADFAVRLSKGMPTWNGRGLSPFQIHETGLSFSVQLNHLAIRLINIPAAGITYKVSHVDSNGALPVPIHLPRRDRWQQPVSIEFKSLDDFIDTIEVNANQSL